MGQRPQGRKYKARRLSTQPNWNKAQRTWLRQVEKTGDMIKAMKVCKPLHGSKWKRSMLDHYRELLAALLPKAPKGCEKYRDDLAKVLGVKVQ